jgi:3-oxoacyl-[acyl-carrier-protein] synthase III
MVMNPFLLNRHGRVVLPSNFLPELDFSVLDSAEQLAAVIRRDFDTKAPTGTDIRNRVERGAYRNRYELMRDVALNLFWANRFAMTMYDKRPTRWRDVPRTRPDVFLPIFTPWQDAERKVEAVRAAYDALPAAWDAAVEDGIFAMLFDVYRHRRHHATELPAIKPTIAEILRQPGNLTWRLGSFDPDYPVYAFQEIADCDEKVPELEALQRWAMVLHNEHPWDRSQSRLVEVGQLHEDDYVVVFTPRSREVQRFIERVRAGVRHSGPAINRADTPEARQPVRPYPPVQVRQRFSVLPRLEALAVVKGEQVCSNQDLIRNAAYSWSPMSAEEIRVKTGIEQRLYTAHSLEDISLAAAQRALAHAGRAPEEIGAVLFCSCTSTRLIPSVATWLSGQLGMYQTHASADIVAACAGMPYGMAEAIRLLQEVERPVLLVCAEKFSDKIGTVRPSRMIFGDGAAAIVVGVAPPGESGDVEVVQTYASGPASQVNSIIWPNPEFDNNITVYGPEVKALAGRYLVQMLGELEAMPDPQGAAANLLETVDLVVPHQANKTMVTDLATSAGLSADRLYFDIAQVGNVSAASIPIAIYDAVREGVIDSPARVFAPGFGAGAVGGYTVLRVDPAIVATGAEGPGEGRRVDLRTAVEAAATSSEDIRAAFGD